MKSAHKSGELPASPWGWLPVAVAFVIVVLSVSPQGEFPLNDDWIYTSAVQERSHDEVKLLDRHRSAYSFPQRVYGRALVEVFGFSHGLLRITGIFAAFLCLFLTHRILRRLGFGGFACMAGAAILLVNPIFLHLAYSFMTDLPYLVFFLAALLATLNAAGPGRRGWLACGTLLTLLAASQRQTGILLCPAAIGFFFLHRKEWRLRPVDWAILLAQIPLFAVLTPLIHPQGVDTAALVKLLDPSRWTEFYNLKPLGVFSAATGVNAAGLYGIVILSIIAYLGLFTLPILLGGLARRKGPGRGLPAGFLLLSLGVLAVVWGLKSALAGTQIGPLQAQSMPFLTNVFHRCGIGPAEREAIVGECIPLFSPFVWNALTFTALLGGAILLSLTILHVEKRLGSFSWRRLAFIPRNAAGDGAFPPGSDLVFLAGLFQIAPLLLIWPQDRYLIPLILPATVVLLEAFRHRGLSKSLPLICLIAFLAYGVAGLHDYLSWNRLRWSLARELVAKGVPEEAIEGGLEWVAVHHHAKPSAGGIVRDASPYIGWYAKFAPTLDPIYLISFSEVPGYEVLETHDWSAWLPRASSRIYVSRRIEKQGFRGSGAGR